MFPVETSSGRSFATLYVRAFVALATDREAGANPALPRNCERVLPSATVLLHGKAAGAGEVPTSNSPSQETGANTDDNPFRVKRRNVPCDPFAVYFQYFCCFL